VKESSRKAKMEYQSFRENKWVEKDHALISIREWKNYALALEKR
jgi:hypothetical protein